MTLIGHAPITRTLWLHFYAELNDFLPESLRNITFSRKFIGTASVKDRIEAIGVPHTEVDLILVNGKSVAFEHLISGGERVCVYPQCESVTGIPLVHLQPKLLPDIRFIVDANLGKLAVKLRLLGFDTLYKNDFADQEIVDLSVREQRIILTRDKGILKYRDVVYGYWVRDDNPKGQLQEVVQRWQLHSHFQPFTRCCECNTPLQPVEKERIKERLADETLQFVDDFMLCPGCNKIYWQGSHYQRFCRYIDELWPN